MAYKATWTFSSNGVIHASGSGKSDFATAAIEKAKAAVDRNLRTLSHTAKTARDFRIEVVITRED